MFVSSLVQSFALSKGSRAMNYLAWKRCIKFAIIPSISKSLFQKNNIIDERKPLAWLELMKISSSIFMKPMWLIMSHTMGTFKSNMAYYRIYCFQGADEDMDDVLDDLFEKYGKVVFRSTDQKPANKETIDDAQSLSCELIFVLCWYYFVV